MATPDGVTPALVLGDFCLSDRYRSLGPALQLQRACLAQVDAGPAAFCYDFPSAGMMAVYRRLGLNPIGTMLRLTLPLRLDHRVARQIGVPWLSRGLSSVGNRALSMMGPRSRAADVSVGIDDRECGEEFSEVAREVGARYGVCVNRTATYLNWRYRDNPTGRFEFVTARRRGRLRAYAVVSRQTDSATLEDLYGADESGILETLLAGVARRLRDERVATLDAPVHDSHPLVSTLRRCGFRPRESRPVVAYAPATGWGAGGRLNGLHWGFLFGDRDS
jgi:hypothetical protein